MANKPKSLTQRATASLKGLSRTKEILPKASEIARPTPSTPSIPEDIEIATEREFPEAEKVNITKKLPRNVAILHIYENGENQYSVWGGHVDKGLLQTDPEKKPLLSLGWQVKNLVPPDIIKDFMNEFSRLNVKLRNWIKGLRSQFGEHLCLVIADYTDFEIPWEMLELSPQQSSHEYIGALITTVRWRKVISVINDDYLVLKFKADECCGKTVAYVLDTELEGSKSELESLKKLQGTIYQSSEDNNSIEKFHTHLQSDDADHSFVYISCHGTFKNSPDEMALGSASNEQQQLKLQILRKRPLNLVQKSQGIVFINACHSAREQVHPIIRHSYRMGFIQLFLEQGARGVIGTLGAVGDIYAAEFACELIKESSQSSPLPVAALLKNLRLKAVKNLGDKPTEEQLLSLIYRFMYVYYGSPMTVLRLTPPGE
ncbi:CHAT domain-containing protein [Nostoc sp.]|uniref:CHAT domain-containing protein n=1 Tax=Nostoc sp. TaxID=1180 RepID=UPI002FFAAA8D